MRSGFADQLFACAVSAGAQPYSQCSGCPSPSTGNVWPRAVLFYCTCWKWFPTDGCPVFPIRSQFEIVFRVNRLLSVVGFRLNLFCTEWVAGPPVIGPSLKLEVIVVVFNDVMICFWLLSALRIEGICAIIWCDFFPTPISLPSLCFTLHSLSLALTNTWVSLSSMGKREMSYMIKVSIILLINTRDVYCRDWPPFKQWTPERNRPHNFTDSFSLHS